MMPMRPRMPFTAGQRTGAFGNKNPMAGNQLTALNQLKRRMMMTGRPGMPKVQRPSYGRPGVFSPRG